MVNNLEDYEENCLSFKDSFEGKDPEKLEAYLEDDYQKIQDDLSEYDRSRLLLAIEMEQAEDEIQDILVEKNYIKKLEEVIANINNKVETKQEAIDKIETGWDQAESYFEETSKLFQAWRDYAEKAKDYERISVNAFKKFVSVIVPFKIKTNIYRCIR